MSIKELRLKTGMKQKDFAEKFGIPVRTLQDWENPKKPNPPEYVAGMLERIVANGSTEIRPTINDYSTPFEQVMEDADRYQTEVNEKFKFVCHEIERMVSRIYPQSSSEKGLCVYAGITPEKAGSELKDFVLSIPEDKEILWLGKKIITGNGFDTNSHCWAIRFTECYELNGVTTAELEIYFKDETGNILEKKRTYHI